jgi:dTDP-4-amino-4,6-dideoxygalactose transaminase
MYISEQGKICPAEILETYAKFNAEGRLIWKPMHMQPIYRMNGFVTAIGNGRGQSNAYIDRGKAVDIDADIFERDLCLPSDNKMTPEEQDIIIEIIRSCFE